MKDFTLPTLTSLLHLKANPKVQNDKEMMLYLALERLVSGKATHPKNQSAKVNFAAIHREAGVSNGTIKYYPNFKGLAEDVIKKYDSIILDTENLSATATLEVKLNKIRAELKKEKELKVKYHSDKAIAEQALDTIVQRETEINFKLYEMENQMRLLWHSNVKEYPEKK
ncbi:hypothetical protein [Shewanella sp. 10N.286.48.B5]|uniref:hypothetical protein n=1 Tax=Shewanella sp. 10N.286.48.B5 TaxID=1880834 RepID=UPI000C850D21|nr:hypothetical protein [Shewanella sp. 10N.286.48.B5]PMH87015.1 hypothetical protein BCU57_08450 [Shewanella sp. 10N.286.48.B5]